MMLYGFSGYSVQTQKRLRAFPGGIEYVFEIALLLREVADTVFEYNAAIWTQFHGI